MDLIVESADAGPLLRAGGEIFRCAVGRGGIAVKLREGDGVTPRGVFALRHVLYRPDRLDALRSGLPAAAIAPGDLWCDAPGDPAYNTMVRAPFAPSAERLWREDALYDVIVVVGYNDDPVVPGAGSAIFVHVARPDFAPTEGCVALERGALIALLPQLDAASRLIVR